MTGSSMAGTLVMLMLGVLACYHLVMGALALFAPSRAVRAAGSLYGARLGDAPQLRYATSMIGALAVAVGGLAAIAASNPDRHRPIVAAVALLQLARLFCRIRDRELLAASLGVTARRNAAMIAVLGFEVSILALAFR